MGVGVREEKEKYLAYSKDFKIFFHPFYCHSWPLNMFLTVLFCFVLFLLTFKTHEYTRTPSFLDHSEPCQC